MVVRANHRAWKLYGWLYRAISSRKEVNGLCLLPKQKAAEVKDPRASGGRASKGGHDSCSKAL